MAFYTTGQLMAQLRARTGGLLKNVRFLEILPNSMIKLSQMSFEDLISACSGSLRNLSV